MDQTFDTLSIGSATLDLLMKSSMFVSHALNGEAMLCEVYGGKTDVEEATITSGGAATNTAVSFARQGLKAAVISEMGQDPAAQIIYDELEREKVDISFLVEEPSEHTALSVVLTAEDASRSVLTYRGASHMLTSSDIPWEKIDKVRWIHVSGLGNPDLVREIFLFCKKHSIKLSWNPSSSDLEEVVFRSGQDFQKACACICINSQEYKTVEREHQKLLGMTDVLIITNGKEGGEVWQNGSRTTYSSLPVHAVCEVGAGDAFVSGFAGATLRGSSLSDAIDFGKRNSASVVSNLGAKKGLLKE